MEINGRQIGAEYPPYIIAEMSNNHLCDFEKAKKIMVAAAESGVDAIKIQTYTADSLTIDCQKPDFVIQDPLWRGQTYYQLYQSISMPLAWTEKLFSFARELGITLFSSPFDEASVDLLARLNAPAYKIASFEANDWPLIQKAAATGKPLIISTGTSTYAEIAELLRQDWLLPENIALLHCVSSYPANSSMMNLKAISRWQELGVTVGLSDHSIPPLASIAAVSLGACIIEKHFTLSRQDGGPDAEFSLEPDELKHLVNISKEAWLALGDAKVLDHEQRAGSQHKRSIYAVHDIAAGELFTPDNIRVIRPGFGLSPRYYAGLLGQAATQDIERGTALNWSLITPQPIAGK